MSGTGAGAQTPQQLQEAARIRALDTQNERGVPSGDSFADINRNFAGPDAGRSFTQVSGSGGFVGGGSPAAASAPPAASGDVPGQGGQDRAISGADGDGRQVARASTARRRSDGAVEERESLLAGGQGFRGARRRLLG